MLIHSMYFGLLSARCCPLAKKVAGYVSGLQQEDGSFFGDEWGEVDTRFSYCALSSMAILGQLDSGKIDVKKAAEFVGRFDGG